MKFCSYSYCMHQNIFLAIVSKITPTWDQQVNESILKFFSGVHPMPKHRHFLSFFQNIAFLWVTFGCWIISKLILDVNGRNWNCDFSQKHPKLFCLYLSNQISLKGRFVFKTNSRITSITSYKEHCCSFFTTWEIKQQKCWISSISENKTNFGCMVHTLDFA